MGFPNVDIFLVDKLLAKFNAVKADPEFTINDLFDDFDSGRRAEVTTYIANKTFVTDLRKRGSNEVFILPHFPLIDQPFPQIAISLGQENTAEKFLDDLVGESEPAYDSHGVQIGWDIPKGYLGAASYRIDVVCATKEEAVWLSRFIQRFICELQDDLDGIGAKEIDVSLADMKLEPEHMPQTVFNRTVMIHCKVENLWKKRIPLSTYQLCDNSGVI